MKWIRKQCPYCSSRTGFAIDSESGGFICHSCKEQGHISKLSNIMDLDHNLNQLLDKRDSRFEPKPSQKPSVDPSELARTTWVNLRPATERGPTDLYLQTRGIHYRSWHDLGLREGKFFDYTIKAVYPFKDMYGEIKALHSTRHNNGIKEKRYIGPKSKGVAMLSTMNPIIIAEGLENALIIRQKFMDERRLTYGLCVGGDSGNIIKYVVDHKIILGKHKYIYVEDNDYEGMKASGRFCRSYNVVENVKTTNSTDAVDRYSSKDAHGYRGKG